MAIPQLFVNENRNLRAADINWPSQSKPQRPTVKNENKLNTPFYFSGS